MQRLLLSVLLSCLTCACAHAVVDGDDVDWRRVDEEVGGAGGAPEPEPHSFGIEPTTPTVPFSNIIEPEIDEMTACELIVDNLHRQGLSLGCATTTHLCPAFMRAKFGEACLLYEHASVVACARRIRAASSCEALRAMSCSVRAVPDSSPDGCP